MKKSANTLFSGQIISLNLEEHLLPDGRGATFEIVRHPGGVAILPILEDGRVVVIRQYRPPVGRMVLEIPAGRLEPREAPEACAERELMEEVGLRPGRLEKLGEMLTAVGFCDELIHLYLARDLEAVPAAPEEDEYIEVTPLPLEELLEEMRQGRISDGKTQLALLLYAQGVGAGEKAP